MLLNIELFLLGVDLFRICSVDFYSSTVLLSSVYTYILLI